MHILMEAEVLAIEGDCFIDVVDDVADAHGAHGCFSSHGRHLAESGSRSWYPAIGSYSSTRLPEGSSSKTWRTPTPMTMPVRKRASDPPSSSTAAGRSWTSNAMRFQPPGSGREPSGSVCAAPG